MKKLVVLAMALWTVSSTYAQLQVDFDGSVGMSIPTNKAFREGFNLGFNADLGLGFKVNDKLSIGPQVGLLWFFKEVEEVNSVQEHVQDWRIGITGQYELLDFDTFTLGAYLGVHYNFIRNYFSQSNFNLNTGQTSTSSSDNLFVGQSLSWSLGSIVTIQGFQIVLDYDFLKPTLTMNEEIYLEALGDGFTLERENQFDFSAIKIALGYTHRL